GERPAEDPIDERRRRRRLPALGRGCRAGEKVEDERYERDAEEEEEKDGALALAPVARRILLLEFVDSGRQRDERDPVLRRDLVVRLVGSPVLQDHLERLAVARVRLDLLLEPAKEASALHRVVLVAGFARIEDRRAHGGLWPVRRRARRPGFVELRVVEDPRHLALVLAPARSLLEIIRHGATRDRRHPARERVALRGRSDLERHER